MSKEDIRLRLSFSETEEIYPLLENLREPAAQRKFVYALIARGLEAKRLAEAVSRQGGIYPLPSANVPFPDSGMASNEAVQPPAASSEDALPVRLDLGSLG